MKGLIYLCSTIGLIVGSYLPVLFHQSAFSAVSIICGLIGGIAGIWAGVKLADYF